MLSISGWFNSLTITVIFIFCFIFGSYIIYKSKKTGTKLLFYSGLYTILAGLVWLGQFVDFITILITEKNIDNSYGLVGLLSEFWLGPFGIIAIYIGSKLIIPERWKYPVLVLTILVIIYEIFLFFDISNVLVFIYPESPGSDIIMENIVIFSITGLLFILGQLFLMVFCAFGFLVRSFQSKGIIKKKFIFLAISFILIILSNVLSALLPTSIAYITKPISRVGFVLTFVFLYWGLKQPKPKKTKEKKVSKDIAEFASYISGKQSSREIEPYTSLKSKKGDHPILIFISYATKDVNTFKIHEIAKALTNFPEIKNVLFWEEFMEDNIFEYMDENLEKCDLMILFCSENSKESIPVKKEWTAAEAIDMPIIPVFYDLNHIPTLLKSRLGVEYDFYDMQKTVNELRNLIMKKLGGLEE